MITIHKAWFFEGPVILSALYWQYLVSLARRYGAWLGCALCKVGRLEWCCCCLRGLLCDSSDTNDALWMVIILLYQDVLLASGSWYAVDITFF